MRTVICNYHADHRLVKAMGDREHPEHVQQWDIWNRHVVRLLASRIRSDSSYDIATISLEDLAQEVMADIWQALPSFRFDSRLQTWIFTVVSNRIARSFRAANAQKRRLTVCARYLDLNRDADEPDHPVEASLEEHAIDAALESLIKRVLAEHPDVRLQVIFHLWHHEDQPLRVIGDRLNLSIPRVHALLNHTMMVLRSDQQVKYWMNS